MKHIMISFVGSNDAGKLADKEDGAVLTALKKRTFNEVHLLWNPSNESTRDFKKIAEYLKEEIIKRKYCSKVTLHQFDCDDVTDHNEIYPKLLEICLSLSLGKGKKFTAAIASGTPAMQSCWILIAESGDFPLELIRSNEPKYGKPLVTQVKLGTGLPRIIRLEEENEALKKENESLIPRLVMDIKNGRVSVGKIFVPLSPIEFSYYRYFAEKKLRGEELERISGILVPTEFLKKIIEYHTESFPESDLFREQLIAMDKSGRNLTVSTFRGNVSKLNKKVRQALQNRTLENLFEIGREGKRHSVSYGIRASAGKIVIKKQEGT